MRATKNITKWPCFSSPKCCTPDHQQTQFSISGSGNQIHRPENKSENNRKQPLLLLNLHLKQAETISDISGEAILRPHGFCRTKNLLVVIPVGIPGLWDGISDIILLSLDKWTTHSHRLRVSCCRLLSKLIWKFGGNYRMVPPSYKLVYKPH